MTQKKKRRRKSGKFAPLIWILTGAIIAFFIAYSRNYQNLPFISKKVASSASASNIFNLTNLLKPLQKTTSSQSVSSITTTLIPTNIATNIIEEKISVKIYLARQLKNAISLVEKRIEIAKTPSPLKETIESLIEYQDEILLNLIPHNARLRKVWIKNGIAFIDFSEEFGYNSYGNLGYKIQIYQVVYTATQFPSVKAVYFYMNGKPADYLGGDGYPVNNPVYPFSSLPRFSMNGE